MFFPLFFFFNLANAKEIIMNYGNSWCFAMCLWVEISFGAAEKRNKMTKLPGRLWVVLLCSRRSKSDRKHPQAVWSEERAQQNRSHGMCVSHGKTFWDFLGSVWSLPGAEGQFPVSADSGNKESLFCTSRCPDRDSTWQIQSRWLWSLLLKTLCALYFTNRACQESRWELLRSLYVP